MLREKLWLMWLCYWRDGRIPLRGFALIWLALPKGWRIAIIRQLCFSCTTFLVVRQKLWINVLSYVLQLYLRVVFCLSCMLSMATSKFLQSSWPPLVLLCSPFLIC
jgi:hypothetical protein